MPSTSNLRMFCRVRQLPLRDRRELKGASWYMKSACKFSLSGIKRVHQFAKTYCPEKWSLEVPRSDREDYAWYAVLDSGAECAHTMQYVEVCELLAAAQKTSTYYIRKQLAIFL